MNYAIIRNTKYTMGQLNVIFRHNERKNTNYSNKEIDKSKGIYNYSIKQCNIPYSKSFNEIKNTYNLQGRIKKTSNVACEYIITSSKEFFEEIGEKETKRYFESGKAVDKVSCTEFWKGKNSYKVLQDNFYKYMTRAGFNLERGQAENNKHIPIEQLKTITNYEMQQFEKQTIQYEKEINTNNINELKTEYKRVIKKFNTLANQYTKIKATNDNTLIKVQNIQRDYESLKENVYKLHRSNKWLKLLNV